MSSIDQRIVQMQFDNKGFENGVRTTLKSLKTLQENLKMKKATDGLGEVDKSIKKLGTSGLSGLSSGIDAITSKFSTMGIIGMTALANITNSAVNAGKKIVNSLTLEPITTGFSEYETKMNSIQTILTNTAHQGTTLDDVTKALNELNTYADKTIYNFAEMTRNIGTFTAAGVDLDTSVMAIKGIANLAAGSGSSPQQAASAMYQLSQALAAGKVGLQDWNSVVNSGMGGKLFQDALMETAKGMGKVIDKSKPFRETLQDGWLTTDVLTKTLKQFADDESLVKAATEVKTLTGLIDTMKESVQSGWALSWEYILGDKDEAAKLFTSISQGFEKLIGPSADARNNMLKFWNDAGGRDDVIKGLTNIINSLGKGLGAVKKAFTEVFPPMTGHQLVDISKKFKQLTEKIKMNDKTAAKIKNTFKGVFSVIDFGKNMVVALLKTLTPVSGVLVGLGDVLLTVSSNVGKFFTSITDEVKSSGIFDKATNGITNVFNKIEEVLSNATKGVESFFKALSKLNFKPIFDFINQVGSGLGSGLETIFTTMADVLGTINFNTIFAAIGALAAGKGLNTIKSIGEIFQDSFNSIFKSTENLKGIGGVLDEVRESLQAYQANLSAGTLVKLAASIGILALSLGLISDIKPEEMESALTGITMLFAELLLGMMGLLKIASTSNLRGFWSISTALVSFSAGIYILASAMKKISNLKWEQLAVGLTGLAGTMTVLAVGTKLISGGSKGLIKTSIGLIILSAAIKSLSDAVIKFGQLKPDYIIQGLFGVGVVLAELAAFLAVTNFNSMGIKNGTGLLILAGALGVISTVVQSLGNLNVNVLMQGLSGIGVILLELAAFVKMVGNGGKILATSVALIAVASAMNLMSLAVSSMGSLKGEVIAKGLLAIAGALTIMFAATKLMSGGHLIVLSAGIATMSGALSLLSLAFKSFGKMTWESMGKSMVALAGSLTILAAAMALMKTGLPGAAAMLVMSGALALFTPQLMLLSQLSLTQIGLGLLALGGAFAVLGVSALVLTPIVPVIVALGGAVALLGLGCTAAGLGVSLFATGLATLAAVAVGGGFGLLEFLRQLIGLLPTLATKLGESLVNFIVVIGNSVPQIVEAAGNMISGILNAFANALPKIGEAALKLITVLCDTLTKALPKLVTTGVNLLLAILQGISENIGKITDTSVEIIIGFVNTLSQNAGKIIQAGIDLAIDLINGLADGIRNNAGRVSDAIINLLSACLDAAGTVIMQFMPEGVKAVIKFIAGMNSKKGEANTAGIDLANKAKTGMESKNGSMHSVGSQLVNGFIGGIKSAASGAVRAAQGVVSSAIDAAKNLLGIHSPSRVFAGIGKWTVLGFAKGLRDNIEISNISSRELARNAIDTMQSGIAKVSDLITGTIDTSPVISPVLDLTSVQEGGKTIRELLSDANDLKLDTNFSGGLSRTIKSIQNGNDNSDLLSALKDIKKVIDNVNGKTYNINGITYNDGSNIGSAIETLISAINVERRI